MEIDWSEVAKNLGTRIANAAIETEQWKNIADTLFKENDTLKREKALMETKLEAYESNAEEPADG